MDPENMDINKADALMHYIIGTEEGERVAKELFQNSKSLFKIREELVEYGIKLGAETKMPDSENFIGLQINDKRAIDIQKATKDSIRLNVEENVMIIFS